MSRTPASSSGQSAAASPGAGPVIDSVKAIDRGPSSRAPLQTWTGKAIAEQIHAKPLGEAYRLWLYHRATRKVRLRDMYSKSLDMFGDRTLTMKFGDEHVFVSQSDSYIRNLGQDLRGLGLSEINVAVANSLREIFNDTLSGNRPVYARFISSLSERNVYWETIILPLSVDERSEPIFNMGFFSMLSEKIDVLQVLYDRSPIGIVAAVPIMNGQHKTDDARVLTMNNKARRILKLDPMGYPMHTVGEFIRYLGETLGWKAANKSSHGHATRIEYRDPAGHQYSMMIELINQLVLITLAEQDGPDAMTGGGFARLVGVE